MSKTRSRPVLGVIFLTVFFDLVGFSVIFPLFPEMLDHYLAVEGESSPVGQLVVFLRRLVGGTADPQFAVVALFGGILGSLYSTLQFVFAPVWGALSDRIGRRPTLLLTLAGTMAGYGLWIVADTFTLLVVSRLLGGIMAGNISTATAVIADTTTGEKRASGMGFLGMAVGLGFIVGPALGGAATLWNPLVTWPGMAGLGLHPFSGAAAVSFVLAAANLLGAAWLLPETRRAAPPGAPRPARATLRPFALLRSLRAPGLRLTNLVYLLYLTAFSAMEFTLTFLAVERFAFTSRGNAGMFVYVGLVIALVQGGLVRRVVPRYGERRVVLLGLSLLIPGFAIIGGSEATATFLGGLGCIAVGSALAMPCLSALASRYASEEHQGLALGTLRSMGALSRAVGPVLGGLLYWRFGSPAPYFTGAGFLFLPALLALLLPPVAGTDSIPS